MGVRDDDEHEAEQEGGEVNPAARVALNEELRHDAGWMGGLRK